MIVVIGAIAAHASDERTVPGGLAARIALTAAGAGARVEVVARIGDDPAGDAVLLALAAAHVGHVATLRDPARATARRDMLDEPIDPDSVTSDAAPPETTDAAASGEPLLDAGDVGLALRYLDGYRVIVVVHPGTSAIVREVVAAADWASAHLVLVTGSGDGAVDGAIELPAGTLVLAAADDADGVGDLVGRYAAAVDAGSAPTAAFEATFGASA